MRQTLTALPLLVLLAACQPGPESAKTVPAPAAAPAQSPELKNAASLPAGVYKVDPDHTSLIFRVDHIGMSKFTAQFRKIDASLTFDPKAPEKSSVTADIDVASVDTKVFSVSDFDKTIAGPDWLDAGAHPKISFRSTSATKTGPDTADVTGDLTLRGVTRPVTLKVKYNDAYATNPMDPHARIGFSATGTIRRSEFGISYGIPAPGTKMGVSDAVEVIIEAEFLKPTAK